MYQCIKLWILYWCFVSWIVSWIVDKQRSIDLKLTDSPYRSVAACHCLWRKPPSYCQGWDLVAECKKEKFIVKHLHRDPLYDKLLFQQ